MRNVLKIIQLFGGVDKFPALKIEVKNYMRLCIERIGVGPRGLPAISVAHYYEQNGDLMKDPDMQFEYLAPGTSVAVPGGIEVAGLEGKLLPYVFEMSAPPCYRQCVDVHQGKVVYFRKEWKDQTSFARTWDKNLGAQGFVKRATVMAQERIDRGQAAAKAAAEQLDQVKPILDVAAARALLAKI